MHPLIPRRLLVVVVVVVVSAVGAVGCSISPKHSARTVTATAASTTPIATSAPDAQGATVVLRQNRFSPAHVTVAVGATISWNFADAPIPHDVSFDDGIASPQRRTGTWTRTFTKVGTYSYYCSIHDGMTGTVTVR